VGERTVEELARRAAAGDSTALSRLVEEVQHPIYRLALRFLGHPEDAKDASQEILIRLITRLGSFEGRSQFMTWAYSVAVRHLMRTRKRLVESSVRSAETFAAFLDQGLSERDYTSEEAEYRLLCEEVRISCKYGMLLCLSRPLRASYILGDAMGAARHRGGRDLRDLSHSAVAAPRPSASDHADDHREPVRARGRRQPVPLRASSREQPGRRILDPDNPQFATHPRSDTRPIDITTITRAAEQLDLALAMSEVYRSEPSFAAPAEVWRRVQAACPDLLA